MTMTVRADDRTTLDPAPAAPLRVLAWPAHARDNPYNTLLYGALRRQGVDVVDFVPRALLGRRAAIWHLHWVEAFWNRRALVRAAWRAAAILAMVRVARWRGTRIVWTVHNLHTHERRHPRLERWFWSRFTRVVDGYVALSEQGRSLALQRFPTLAARPGFVVPHGHYRDAYPDTTTREQARRHLGLPDHGSVVAFIGKVRPYKNVPHLIRTFRALAAPELRLVVAGQPNAPASEQDVRAEAARDERVHLSLRHIPDAEVQLFLRAADLIVLPYEDILNSGSALLALSFDRPVLVPDRGAMGELARQAGTDWVRTYSGALTPAVLEGAVRWAAGARGRRCEGLDALSWDELGRATLRAFTGVLNARRPARFELQECER
jgi:beta-1,4-mannosyltransferase